MQLPSLNTVLSEKRSGSFSIPALPQWHHTKPGTGTWLRYFYPQRFWNFFNSERRRIYSYFQAHSAGNRADSEFRTKSGAYST